MYILRSAWLAMKGQLRYRSTMLIAMAAQALTSATAVAGIAMLFMRFPSLGGYTREQALLLFGLTQTAFSVSEFIVRGFDRFESLLSDGSFDRILLRPRSPTAQVLAARFDYSRFGRLALSLAVLAWAIPRCGAEWTGPRILTLALRAAGGAAIFSSVFIMGAALAFLTTDALEFVNVLTDGGRELAQYPLSIYGKWLRRAFTFLVPFACVNYLPLAYILGRPGAGAWSPCLPLAGFAFLVPAFLVWRAGVRRYRSTGS